MTDFIKAQQERERDQRFHELAAKTHRINNFQPIGGLMDPRFKYERGDGGVALCGTLKRFMQEREALRQK